MTTITLTPEQVASVLAQSSGDMKPGIAVIGSPLIERVGTLDKNGAPFHSGDYAAGSGFALAFDVADDEVGAKTLTFGQSGTLGGSMKVVTLEKDGVVIPVSGNRAQNAASIVVNMGNPTAPNNLSPGRWLVKVLFSDPGAAVVVLG